MIFFVVFDPSPLTYITYDAVIQIGVKNSLDITEQIVLK